MSDVSLPQTLVIGHLWQSVALAAVLACVLIAGKRMRASARYGLAVAAFAASILLPLAAFIPGETIVAGLLRQINAPVSVSTHAGAPQAAATTPMAAGLPMMAATLDVTPVVFHAAPPVAGAPPAHAAAAPAVAPAPALFTLPALRLPDIGLPLLAVWLAVAAVLLLRTLRDLLAVERLVARARPADLPPQLAARMAGVRVVVSPEAPGPMAAGLLRPSIVLPESIALASPGMAALLEHEHAHIRRRDMLAALTQRIVLSLLWWSPALYWISRRIDEEREVACDEAAVACTGDAKAFARSLTSQAENQLWARAPRLAVGAIGPRSQVGRRIRRLIDIARTGGAPARYSGRLAFAGLALTVAVAAMVTPRFTAQAQPPAEGPIDIARPLDQPPQDPSPSLDGDKDKDVERDFTFRFDFDSDDPHLAALGAEMEALMAELGPEIEATMAALTPELQLELASLGAEISAVVGQSVMAEMPAIMAEVEAALAEAGIDPEGIEGWEQFQEFDDAELREALEGARIDLKQALGPELQDRIREAMDEAREQLAGQREEIREALRESHDGMAIAREALAAARAELEAARARGDLRFGGPDGEKLGADIERRVKEALAKAGIDAGHPHPVRVSRISLPGAELYGAADDCDMETLNRLLVEGKADANVAVPGRGTALMAAAASNCADGARALINAGADVNASFPGRGTALSIAVAEEGAAPVAQLLVNRKADLNAAAPGRRTPLATAVSEGDFAMVKLLVEAGADVNLRSLAASNRTPLRLAEQAGEDEIAAYLRSKGARAD